MFPTVIALAAAEVVTAKPDHTWEMVLVFATVGLTIVTGLLIVVSLRLARATEADAAKLANNSVDSMEHVAVTALSRADKIRALNMLASRHHTPPRPRHRTML